MAQRGLLESLGQLLIAHEVVDRHALTQLLGRRCREAPCAPGAQSERKIRRMLYIEMDCDAYSRVHNVASPRHPAHSGVEPCAVYPPGLPLAPWRPALRWSQPAGGLTSALDPGHAGLPRHLGGLGERQRRLAGRRRPRSRAGAAAQPQYTLRCVWLSEAQVAGFTMASPTALCGPCVTSTSSGRCSHHCIAPLPGGQCALRDRRGGRVWWEARPGLAPGLSPGALPALLRQRLLTWPSCTSGTSLAPWELYRAVLARELLEGVWVTTSLGSTSAVLSQFLGVCGAGAGRQRRLQSRGGEYEGREHGSDRSPSASTMPGGRVWPWTPCGAPDRMPACAP